MYGFVATYLCQYFLIFLDNLVIKLVIFKPSLQNFLEDVVSPETLQFLRPCTSNRQTSQHDQKSLKHYVESV